MNRPEARRMTVKDTDAPLRLWCPCGKHAAYPFDHVTRETHALGDDADTVIVHYRHAGCPYGGAIVYCGGEESHRVGPLFHPDRYSVETPPEPAEARPLPAD